MSPNNNQDHHFSSFAMGVTIGVVAALLFGTEEGRKLVKEMLDAIPEKYKTIPEELKNPKADQIITPTPIIEPLETPHHATFDNEIPLRPSPSLNPTRPQ